MVVNLRQLQVRIPLRWNQQLRMMESRNNWLFQIHNTNRMFMLAVKPWKLSKLPTVFSIWQLALAKHGQNVAAGDWSVMMSRMTSQQARWNQTMSHQNLEQEEKRAKKHLNESLIKRLGYQKLQWTWGMFDTYQVGRMQKLFLLQFVVYCLLSF